jgi:hypothetical protein
MTCKAVEPAQETGVPATSPPPSRLTSTSPKSTSIICGCMGAVIAAGADVDQRGVEGHKLA